MSNTTIEMIVRDIANEAVNDFKEYELEELVSKAVKHYMLDTDIASTQDVKNIVRDYIDEIDLEDSVKEAIEDMDLSIPEEGEIRDLAESAIDDYNFTGIVNNHIEDYDFSRIIENYLDERGIDREIEYKGMIDDLKEEVLTIKRQVAELILSRAVPLHTYYVYYKHDHNAYSESTIDKASVEALSFINAINLFNADFPEAEITSVILKEEGNKNV